MTDPAPYLEPIDVRKAYSPLLDDDVKFTDDLLAGLVAEFEGDAERYLGRAFRPRVATETLRGVGCSPTLFLANVATSVVTSITVDGTAFTDDELAAVTVWADGTLTRSAGWPGAQYVVVYPYGETDPTAALLRACKEFVRAKALKTVGTRPRSGQPTADGAGNYPPPRKAVDWSKGIVTGIDEVDDILNKLDRNDIPGIG